MEQCRSLPRRYGCAFVHRWGLPNISYAEVEQRDFGTCAIRCNGIRLRLGWCLDRVSRLHQRHRERTAIR